MKDNGTSMFQGMMISHLCELKIPLRTEYGYSTNDDHWLTDGLIHSLIDLLNQQLLLRCYYVNDIKKQISSVKLLGRLWCHICRSAGILPHCILSRAVYMQWALKNLWRKLHTIFSLKTGNLCMMSIWAHI